MGEIYVIAVDPCVPRARSGQGADDRRLDHLAQQGLTIGMLHVDAANTAAMSLYERLGFAFTMKITPTSATYRHRKRHDRSTHMSEITEALPDGASPMSTTRSSRDPSSTRWNRWVPIRPGSPLCSTSTGSAGAIPSRHRGRGAPPTSSSGR
jgi:hypothetical protein